MKVERYIVILLAMLVLVLPVSAKKKPQPEAAGLSVEQQQQFRYYWYAARQAIEEERYADAYALLQFCQALDPSDGQTLYYLGILYQGMKQTDKAQEYFDRAYQAMPYGTAPTDLLERIKVRHIADKQWKSALAMQDEIDEKEGYDAYSAIARYRIYAMWGKYKKAIAEIDRYLKTDPTNLQFLIFRLELMEGTGAKPKELYAMYERILEIAPYNLVVLNNYAYLLATHKGDLKKAEQMSQMTIREEPNNPTFLDTYGWIMHLQGQNELARFYLSKALQNATNENRDVITEHLIKVKDEK